MPQNKNVVPNVQVDSYFSDAGHRGVSGDIRLRDLPYITRPIIEYIHDHPTRRIVASDRGGRLVAHAVMQGWHRRYPGERFPTEDGMIHFARVTSRSASADNVRRVVQYTLERAGIPRQQFSNRERVDGSPTDVMLLDDWAVYGGTAERFIDACKDYGLPVSGLAYATMCGKRVDGITHVIGDMSRDPRRSDWFDREDAYVGVAFSEKSADDRVTPFVHNARAARRVREQINGYMDAYYSQYSAALAAGEIAACACMNGA